MEKEFIQLIEEHQGIIFKICRMYCFNKEDSDDLFQEIVLETWRSYPTFKGQSKVTTWLYRLGLNVAITSFKKRKKRPDNQSLQLLHENISSGEERRIDIDLDSDLQIAFNGINRFDKALVMLYLEEKSYKEIAEIMNLTESNVGVKINRIKKKLQQLLKP